MAYYYCHYLHALMTLLQPDHGLDDHIALEVIINITQICCSYDYHCCREGLAVGAGLYDGQPSQEPFMS